MKNWGSNPLKGHFDLIMAHNGSAYLKQYFQMCFITQLRTLCVERDPIKPHYFAFMTKICIVATIRQT